MRLNSCYNTKNTTAGIITASTLGVLMLDIDKKKKILFTGDIYQNIRLFARNRLIKHHELRKTINLKNTSVKQLI